MESKKGKSGMCCFPGGRKELDQGAGHKAQESASHLLLHNTAVLGRYHCSAKIHPVLTQLYELWYLIQASLLSVTPEKVKSFASKGQCCQVTVHPSLVPVPQPEQVFSRH